MTSQGWHAGLLPITGDSRRVGCHSLHLLGQLGQAGHAVAKLLQGLQQRVGAVPRAALLQQPPHQGKACGSVPSLQCI